MGDSLELIGKRLFLLLDGGRSANGTEPEKAVWARDWLRGTVQAVSVIGLTAPVVSEGEATTTSTTAGLTVSVYIQVVFHEIPHQLSCVQRGTTRFKVSQLLITAQLTAVKPFTRTYAPRRSWWGTAKLETGDFPAFALFRCLMFDLFWNH